MKEPTDIHQSLPNTNVNDTSLSLQEIPVQKPAAVGLNRFDLLIEDNLPSQVLVTHILLILWSL